MLCFKLLILSWECNKQFVDCLLRIALVENRDQQPFMKSQTVNIFRFVAHIDSVTTIHL